MGADGPPPVRFCLVFRGPGGSDRTSGLREPAREMQSAAAYAVEVDLPRLGRLPGRLRGVQSAAAYAVKVAFPGLLRREGTFL